MEKVKIAIIGTGLRGAYTYAPLIEKYKDKCEIVAFVENKKGRRDLFLEKYPVSEDMVFDNLNDFVAHDKLADAVIISHYDLLHYDTAQVALVKGYDVLVETPVANSLDGLVHLKEYSQKNKDRLFMVAYNNRYSDFYKKLKEIVDNKELGNLINISYNVDIGYQNFVHNYVRGNWRITSDTATIMLTNSCQDIDMMISLSGGNCQKVSCFSDLRVFNWENFNTRMSENCFRCGEEELCPFSAKKMYLQEDKFINNSIHIKPTKENLEAILKEGPYGKCVFYCDNDVCDNLTSIFKFDNKVTANFNINAFTKESDKKIRLFFKEGEVEASFKEKEIKIKKFLTNNEEVIKIEQEDTDEKLFVDFIDRVKNKNYDACVSDVGEVIQSHVVTFAAEFANVSETVVDVKSFFDDAVEMTKQIEKMMF
ncbi:Gfo/Idh/MocA family protein [Intestinibacter sp.]|uniref:Gfo/Idh/MocA family protein n=1 Tax=Intestinibacter sp. TaxID=1965304 RepID=UPI002A914D98|nr:Gfo/Idh/MocA family oxidoreductase [Intestinibacter sp.]MDY5211493.1 Gfo/Idh/MocA family oxidoreductase [Intestinibacter sp.]